VYHPFCDENAHRTPRLTNLHPPPWPRQFPCIVKSFKPPSIEGDSRAQSFQGLHHCSPYIESIKSKITTTQILHITGLIMAQAGGAQGVDDDLRHYQTLTLSQLEQQFAAGQKAAGKVRSLPPNHLADSLLTLLLCPAHRSRPHAKAKARSAYYCMPHTQPHHWYRHLRAAFQHPISNWKPGRFHTPLDLWRSSRPLHYA
jgi:hypothetical protein